MSEKLPTVVRYQAESPEQRKLVTYEMPKGNSKRGFAKCRPLTAKRSSSFDCGTISNPWLLRAGLAILAIVLVVVFVALYSKMQAKVDDMESRLEALEELVRRLEDRIQCSVMHQSETKPCDQNAAATSRGRKSPGPTASTRPSSEQKTAEREGLAFGALFERRTTSAQKLPQKNQPQATTLYTAWGVRSCPGNTERVYNGIGVISSEKSALLCLEANDLRYMQPADISGVDRVQIHPVRFGNTLGILENRNTTNRQVLCAVCKSTGKSAALMVPGRTECHTIDWQKEYHGYLMTSGDDFICVKRDATMGNPSRARSRVEVKLTQYLKGVRPNSPVTCVVCLK